MKDILYSILLIKYKALHPVLINLILTSINLEYCLKNISLILSICYLLYRWRIDYKKNNKGNENE